MCNCMRICRLPDIETSNGRWPLPEHAPVCEDYRLEEFIVVEYDGSRCVMEPKEAQEMVADSSEEYAVSTVWITRDQFENMSEFDGF